MIKLDNAQTKRVEEIRKWAESNNNRIGYITLQDMLQFENQSVTKDEEMIQQIIQQLQKSGILVEALEEGESYETSTADEPSFVPALVNIKEDRQSISNIIERLENEEIDLSPSFQRHWDLWNDEKQSQLIESLMLRIPIPNFYFDMTVEGKWKVIDGLQRLNAFKNYLVGQKNENGQTSKRKLTKLQYLKDFNGCTFDELPRQYIRRIKEASVTVYGVLKGTPESVVYNIFQRINTGGLHLEPQEIRNAMYQGNVTALISRLAQSTEFLEATGSSISPVRMMDQEYVLRYIAFTELDYTEEYKDDIDQFLIKAMKKVNTYEACDLARIEAQFLSNMRYAKDLLGRNAFRRVGEDGKLRPMNKALFEMMGVCFKELNTIQKETVLNNKESFIQAYYQLFKDQEFLAALKSGKRTDCIKRIQTFREILGKFI